MDKLVELASRGDWSQAVVLVLVVLFVGLVRRSIKNVDDKIKENEIEVDRLRIIISGIVGDVSYIRGYLEGNAQEENVLARNRRSND